MNGYYCLIFLCVHVLIHRVESYGVTIQLKLIKSHQAYKPAFVYLANFE